MSAGIFGVQFSDTNQHAFTRLVERLMLHLNFTDISNVDGSGDGGADLVGRHSDVRWVIQAKSKKTNRVDSSAIEELLEGMRRYDAQRGAVVTNGLFDTKCEKRAEEISGATGITLRLWDRDALVALFSAPGCGVRSATPELRKYQLDAFHACYSDLKKFGSAFLVLATGLGKTVIAGSVIDRYLADHPGSKVLVLADKVDLVEQLERAIWRHLPKSIPTQQIVQGQRPYILKGVTIATIQSATEYVRSGFRPDFIFIDEAHHAGEFGGFSEVLALCPKAWRLGATATPWRGDKFDVGQLFGEPSVKIGIEEGMKLGYLSDVDYRLYVDDIQWDVVRNFSKNRYSIGDLNRRLFLPQRDERIRDELLEVWLRSPSPRGIVFCATVDHAEHLLSVLRGVPAWYRAATVHSKMPKSERRAILAKFRLGDIPLLVAIDVLNEGIDVPDVNIVCFARVTHSRRIFIQQLGRGLRLREGKTHVTVLDFVSDLRRIKAILDLKVQVTGETESVLLPASHSIKFSDVRAESIFKEWLFDVASLETSADEVKLDFPQLPVI